MIKKILDRLFGKGEAPKNHLEQKVPESLIKNFVQQARQKIATEGWAEQGRNVEVKIRNFVSCWVTEEAFKQILIQKGKWFRYRGLYFGDAEGAGADFTVRLQGKQTTIGIRSISPESLEKWKTVAYPDDRFRNEKENAQKSEISGTSKSVGGIADYHVVCSRNKGKVRIYGIISKEDLLMGLGSSKRMYSPKNQEHFRVVPIEKFEFGRLTDFLNSLDKN